MLTDKEYIKNPTFCPKCEAEDVIFFFDYETEGILTFMSAACACGFTYTEVYELRGFQPDEDNG